MPYRLVRQYIPLQIKDHCPPITCSIDDPECCIAWLTNGSDPNSIGSSPGLCLAAPDKRSIIINKGIAYRNLIFTIVIRIVSIRIMTCIAAGCPYQLQMLIIYPDIPEAILNEHITITPLSAYIAKKDRITQNTFIHVSRLQ